MNPLRLLGAAQTARPRQAARGRACFMKKKLVQAAMVASANTSSATHLSGLVRGHPLYTAAKPARARARRLGAAPRSCGAPQSTGMLRVQPPTGRAHCTFRPRGPRPEQQPSGLCVCAEALPCALQPEGAAPGCMHDWRRSVQLLKGAWHEERRMDMGPEQPGA